MLGAFLIFLVVFLLNLIPAFAPPTWMVLSYLGIRYSNGNIPAFALIAAVAATLGRLILAKGARDIVRNRFMSDYARKNVDAIRERLEQRRKLTFSVFLFYAFSPLPSNFLFIAYGMTGMKLPAIVAPFFLGRFVSYNFWGMAGGAAARALTLESTEAFSYLGIYFLLTQALLLSIVYGFTRVDWRHLFSEKKFRWLAANVEEEEKGRSPKEPPLAGGAG
jgi:membrane protein DedA with SNARE-associated domain